MTQPLYDRHRGNLAVELMHGGRWAGHSVHAALSDLPIGFWSGHARARPAGQGHPGRGRPAGPGGHAERGRPAAAAATVATGVTDWTVSDNEDRRVGLFHGVLNPPARRCRPRRWPPG